jgi:formylglycine-generating enzyme required for sulfatase activity
MVSDLILVAGGEFVMGDDEGRDDERPPHLTAVDPFAIGKYPVTNAEYADFVRETDHPAPRIRALPAIVESASEEEFRKLAELHQWSNGAPPPGREQHPVTLVGFADAKAYCEWRSRKTERLIRLPSEAEWEKAARGGLESNRFPWGNNLDETRANYLPDGAAKHERNTSPVGSYPPNTFGLHDMAGNVWEWVSDWYASDYYSRTPYTNPRGPEDGTMRIVRGGAWVSGPGYLRCGCRHELPPDSYAYSIGFRVASKA